MVGTLGAQFLSALADNALLFATLALVRKAGYPAWSGPLIQEFFVGARDIISVARPAMASQVRVSVPTICAPKWPDAISR